jgi:hypothetical protein
VQLRWTHPDRCITVELEQQRGMGVAKAMKRDRWASAQRGLGAPSVYRRLLFGRLTCRRTAATWWRRARISRSRSAFELMPRTERLIASRTSTYSIDAKSTRRESSRAGHTLPDSERCEPSRYE